LAVLSVRVIHDETMCEIDWDGEAYSADVAEDLCRRASLTVMTTVTVLAEEMAADG